MTKNYRKIAVTTLIIELILLAVMVFSYLWLVNVLIGAFMALFFIAAGAWIISVIFTTILLKKTKQLITENSIN